MSAFEKDEISSRTGSGVRETNTGIYNNVRLNRKTSEIMCDENVLSCCRYEPEDHLEWSLVLDEIKGFIKAEAAVAVLHADSNPIVLSHR